MFKKSISLYFCSFCSQIQRYNTLLDLIRQQLTELERGIQGLVVMSTDLEEVFNCIFDARVPPSWEKVFVNLILFQHVMCFWMCKKLS